MSMGLIDDLVEKLPEHFRELVRVHLVTMARLTFEEKQGWLMLLYDHRWKYAYQSLNDRLSPSERIGEQERLNKMMVEYNQGNSEKLKMWSDFYSALVAIGISRVSEEI